MKPTPFEVKESDVLLEAKRGDEGCCSSGKEAEERINKFYAEKR